MPKAILFDLDNTLIDKNQAHLRYCQEFAERFLRHWPKVSREEAIRDMVQQDDFGYAPRERYFRWMAERFSSGTLTAVELWEDYQSRLPSYFSRNEAICELLGRLSETYRLAIVSNGSSRNQRRKLMQSGLTEMCSVVLISGEVGVEKPDPAMFRLALDALDCDAERALFVGDDPDRDIAGAARVGLETCWVALARSLDILTVRPTFHIETVLGLETQVLHECQGIDRNA